jgi:uncharacterized membrane protein
VHEPSRSRRRLSHLAIATLFVGAGLLHFARPAFYERIVPPGFGPPRLMVHLSGAAEIAGGVGVLVPRLRRPAGWGLIALLVAVFPANVYMAVARERFAHVPGAPWSLYARLPLQFAIIYWVWRVTLRSERRES